MDSEMMPRINTARHLYEDIARIGALPQRRPAGRVAGEDGDSQAETLNGMQTLSNAALPVCPPNDLSGKLVKIVVSDATARQELSGRLQELKLTLLDLCERQLNDLVDAAPAGQQQDIEDVDRLIVEMQSLRQGMETIVTIQRVLDES